MTNEQRILELAQDIYLTRNDQRNDAQGTDLEDFIDTTIGWVNQFVPEIEKKADWNFVRTNDDDLGTVQDTDSVSYTLPLGVRKLVINPYRDLTLRQDPAVIASFKLVNPNQQGGPNDYDTRHRATVIGRNIIFSRKMTEQEVGSHIVADSIAFIPKLSRDDVSLLDLFDVFPDIRQLFVLGVVKNQILPDIVQGGLTPSFSQKFDAYLADCIAENNASADASDADRENLGWVSGVGW